MSIPALDTDVLRDTRVFAKALLRAVVVLVLASKAAFGHTQSGGGGGRGG